MSKQKYSLNNSYFKFRKHDMPGSPIEITKFHQEKNELPFAYNGDNWMYDMFIEYQKRNGVYSSQFFTPDATAHRMADLANEYFDTEVYVLDACCGFGQISRALHSYGFLVTGFDIDKGLIDMYHHNVGAIAEVSDFREYTSKYKHVVSNPPYEVPVLTEFLQYLHNTLETDGRAILLLPKGFIDKERPKTISDIMAKFVCLHREDMQEDFSRTKIKAEIIVLHKN